MKYILVILLVLFSGVLKAQYNPTLGNPSNNATGYSQATPSDMRSMFFDVPNGKYRDYQNKTEVVTYLTLTKNRFGGAPIFIHNGGTLVSGVWIGGKRDIYIFRDSTDINSLVLWNDVQSVNGQKGVVITKNADSIRSLPVDTSLRRNGYALVFDSTNHKWYLAPNGTGAYTSGTGIDVTGQVISALNTQAIWNANALRGRNITTNTPGLGNLLYWDGTSINFRDTVINNPGSGTVTNVASGYGLAGGPITTIGTLRVDSSTLSNYYLRKKDSTLYYTKYDADTSRINIYDAINSIAGGGITQLTGDGTAGPGSGSQVFTLATVNTDVGSFTKANITVDGTGRITAASNGSAVTSISQGYGILNSPNPITATGTTTLDSATVYTKVRNIVHDSVSTVPTIYTSDGTLTSPRVVDVADKNLNITGSTGEINLQNNSGSVSLATGALILAGNNGGEKQIQMRSGVPGYGGIRIFDDTDSVGLILQSNLDKYVNNIKATDSAYTTTKAVRSMIGDSVVDITASNGLTKTGDTVKLGGTLSANTTVNLNGMDLLLSGPGRFMLKATSTADSTMYFNSYTYHNNNIFLDNSAIVGQNVAGTSILWSMQPYFTDSSFLFQNSKAGSFYAKWDKSGKWNFNSNTPLATSLVSFTFNGTDAAKLPIGTTAQRPTGAIGYIRANTDSTNAFEYWDGTQWQSLASKNYVNTSSAVGVIMLDSISDMQAYTGPSYDIYVEAEEDGGRFHLYTGLLPVNDSTIYAGAGGRVWERDINLVEIDYSAVNTLTSADTILTLAVSQFVKRPAAPLAFLANNQTFSGRNTFTDFLDIQDSVRLGTVPAGDGDDSVLVKKPDGGVYKIAQSSLGSTPTLQQVFNTEAGGSVLTKSDTVDMNANNLTFLDGKFGVGASANSLFRVGQGSSSFLVVDPDNNLYEFGDINGIGNSSYLDIQDAAQTIELRATNRIDLSTDLLKWNSDTVATRAYARSVGGSGSSQWTTTGSDIYYTTGNVGIGTTGPSYPLHVSKTVTGSVLADVTNLSTAGGAVFAGFRADNSNDYGQMFKTGTNYSAYKILSPADFGIYNAATGNMSFLNDNSSGSIRFAAGSSSTANMTIASTGRIGIANTSPDSTLQVTGSFYNTGGVRMSGLPSGVGTKAIRYNPSTGTLTYADTTTGGGTTYTFSTGLTNTSSTITNDLSTGVSGGQSVVGGTASGNNLTLSSTTNGTKGKIIFGSASAYDQVNDRLGIGTTSPTYDFHISKGVAGQVANYVTNTTASGSSTIAIQTDGSGGIAALQSYGSTFSASGSAQPGTSRLTGSSSLYFDALDYRFYGGNVGIGLGTSSPGALLHLAAGTASVPPLKFTSGTNLTTPAAGAVEWDGVNIYATQTSGPTRKPIAYTTEPFLGLRDLGSNIIGESIGTPMASISSSIALNDNQVRYVAVYLPAADTIKGVKWYMATQGSYTADQNNYIALYSYSGGTMTQVAISSNDGNLWKATANTFVTTAFTTPYAAAAGVYYVGMLYNSSAQTTAPQVGNATSSSTNVNAFDFTNSAKLNSTLSGQNSMPSPQAQSGTTISSGRTWVGLYY